MTVYGDPAVILGANAATEQGTRFRFDYFGGESRQETWRGPAVACYTKYTSLKAAVTGNPSYDSVEFDAGRGVGQVTANIIEDGEPVYELFANEERRAIESHPYFLIGGELLGGDPILPMHIRIVMAWFDDPDNYEPATSWATDYTAESAKMGVLFKMLASGQDEYLMTSYVLRETKNVSKRSTVSAGYGSVDKVAAPPSVSAVNTLIGELPVGEWLQRGPIIRQMASRRWQIVTEWWWAVKWSSILYGGTLDYE